MTTRTLYYPSVKKPELEVEVIQDGTIVNAFALIPSFDVWVDAREYIKNRPKLIEEIRDDAACLNWNDDDDFKYESYRDFLKETRHA